jgi:hypothetical protein
MKAAGIKEIKTALETLDQEELVEYCIRLARFKQENKELLTYLLFESSDEDAYISHVSEHISEMFTEVNKSNVYFAKKTIRKILRVANKCIRYSGRDLTQAEILLLVASEIRKLGLPMEKSTVLQNLYCGVLKKAKKCVEAMHEDLQYEFLSRLDKLS